MQDKELKCKDCGADYLFTVGEQEFFKEKGFDNEPVRCPDCRRARKQQNQSGGGYNNNSNNSGGGRRY